jgi:hypothetical protein
LIGSRITIIDESSNLIQPENAHWHDWSSDICRQVDIKGKLLLPSFNSAAKECFADQIPNVKFISGEFITPHQFSHSVTFVFQFDTDTDPNYYSAPVVYLYISEGIILNDKIDKVSLVRVLFKNKARDYLNNGINFDQKMCIFHKGI